MLAILNSLNVHSFHIFQQILMILVSKFMVHRALSEKKTTNILIIRVDVPFINFFLLSSFQVSFLSCLPDLQQLSVMNNPCVLMTATDLYP